MAMGIPQRLKDVRLYIDGKPIEGEIHAEVGNDRQVWMGYDPGETAAGEYIVATITLDDPSHAKMLAAAKKIGLSVGFDRTILDEPGAGARHHDHLIPTKPRGRRGR